HAELTPVFEMGVLASHGGESISRPLICPFQIRRTGQARSDSIRQPGGVLHDMGVRQPFVTNALVYVEIEIVSRRLRLLVGRLAFLSLRVFGFFFSGD